MNGALLRIFFPALACACWLAPWARAQEGKAASGGLTGAIAGKPFVPDQITLEGEKLTFRSGKDFFPDMEITLTLPHGSSSAAGKTLTLGGKGFAQPTIWVKRREDGPLPKTDFVHGPQYAATLRLGLGKGGAVEGTIDLKISKPADTYLTGTFVAEGKKAPGESLGAADAPYVQGRIVIKGDWQEDSFSAGFVGKAADGKTFANLSGTKLSRGKGGHSTSLTFKPQLTSLFNHEEKGPGYAHSHLKPGEYLVYVRRNEVVAGYKRVSVKPGAQLSVDLTIDLAQMGRVVVKPSTGTSEADVMLVPVEFAGASAEIKRVFTVGQMGTDALTIEGVPAGRYQVVCGNAQAGVEVKAGRDNAVVLPGATAPAQAVGSKPAPPPKPEIRSVKTAPPSPAAGAKSPANGAKLRQGEGEKWRFAWEPLTGAVEYELVVTGPTATKPMIKEKTATPSYEYTCGSGRIMGHNKKGWTWTVRAKDAQGNWGEWTEKSTFDVE